MTKTLEFHYDFSCPYAYLASTKVRRIADAAGATLEHRPFLLGGVFRALGSETPDVLPMSAARARLNGLDMQRFAELFDVPLVMPKTHPNRTVTALRATLASGDIARASDALFAAYWREGLDLSDQGVIARALEGVGLDGAGAVSRASEPRFKDDLRARTDEAVARGVFGAPACFVDGELYWGQDRLDFVAEALGLDASALGLAPLPQGLSRVGEVEFFYDFSSPFAYLASTQIERVATSAGARVVFRPFLLGALFKNIGTSNVPMLGFSAAKQAFIARDIDRHAKRYGVPFQFPSTFPIRSVTPLRVALAAGEQIGPLTRTLFHAAWAQDRDISSPDSLRDILAHAGHDPELVTRTEDPAIKDQLRESTDRAQQLGLCGAPSFLVGEHVFWGQDRLELVRRALEGWRPRAG
ncbi:MAG: 2-hydroxychromene-2-carboxylate isomerase [Polyangiaceae bacterium]|nr:2-hydroxychromene-2-carboxylate isomerase [Polyangiaceae bacterium]